MSYLLAIDQGTHASRVLLLNQHGQVVSKQVRSVSLARPGPGRVEQDATEILTSVLSCVSAVLDKLPAPKRNAIAGCGLVTQRSTVLAWEKNGALLSKAINWQDTRGEAQLRGLDARADSVRRITGLPLSAHYGASKLHHLHSLFKRNPNLRLGPLASFLLERLIEGHPYCVDHSNAQRMQLFDIQHLDWSPRLGTWFEVPVALLPACQPMVHPYGSLHSMNVPVTSVCGDQNAAWFANGPPAANTALVNLGSGAFLMASQPASATDVRLLQSIVYSDRERCEFVLEGTVNGSGNALDWFKRRWRVTDLESRLPLWLQKITRPALFLNTVGGLGSPWWRQDLQPKFVREAHTASIGELATGVAESILFLIQSNLEILQASRAIKRLNVAGGLSQIDALCQKLADLSGLPVQRTDDPEASARGAAWLAAGCPREWRIECAAQFFAPEVDTELQERYANFREQLDRYLDSPR